MYSVSDFQKFVQMLARLGITLGVQPGPTISTGAGAPTATSPSGSIWIRTDGAVGSHIYVSNGGGTWNAISGV